MSIIHKFILKSNSLANKITLWVSGLVLIFFGLIMFVTSKLGATFIIAAGILSLPPIFSLLRKKLLKKPPLDNLLFLVVAIFVLFAVGLKLIFSQQEVDDLERKQKKIAEWQENKQKIIEVFDGYLSSNDALKASEILNKYKNLIRGDKDIQGMTDKINDFNYAKKKKESGPSDINDLLLPKNWTIWGLDGKRYYRNFEDNNKHLMASLTSSGSLYLRYSLTFSKDGEIIGLEGEISNLKSHKQIRERMAELCGLDINQIKVVEGGSFYNAEFAGKYAKCTYGLDTKTNSLQVSFSQK